MSRTGRGGGEKGGGWGPMIEQMRKDTQSSKQQGVARVLERPDPPNPLGVTGKGDRKRRSPFGRPKADRGADTRL